MKIYLLIILLFSPLVFGKDKSYGSITVSEIGTIYDGDTFYVTIKRWPPIVGSHIPVRVKGVDTPEIKGNCFAEIEMARRAKQFTVIFLRGARRIELKKMSRDKYFRINADVYADGKSLSAALINNGLGYAYEGKTKRNWCGG